MSQAVVIYQSRDNVLILHKAPHQCEAFSSMIIEIMPFAIHKNTDGSFRVVNSKTGKVHAKHSTKAHAEAQVRLLRMMMGRELK